MSDERHDPVIGQVRETLRADRRLAADPAGVARVLQAVWASPRPSWWRRALESWRLPALSGLGAGAVAVAALVLGFVSRGAVTSRSEDAPTVASGPATGEYPVQLAAAEAELRVPTQFVFEAADAERVSVLGDFNEWADGALPMTRVAGGLWTATVPLPPGRHVYAFMVDGRLLVADPRAPKAGDADYGREGSVVMVFAR